MYDIYKFQAKAARQPLALRDLRRYVNHMLKVTKQVGDKRVAEMGAVFGVNWGNVDQNVMFAANADRVKAYTNMMTVIAQWNTIVPEQQVIVIEIDVLNNLKGGAV